jgi:hypothetical protein
LSAQIFGAIIALSSLEKPGAEEISGFFPLSPFPLFPFSPCFKTLFPLFPLP